MWGEMMPYANRAKRKEYLRRYAQSHKEDIKRNQRKYRVGRGVQYYKTYYAENKERIKAKTRYWNRKIKLLVFSAYSKNGIPQCVRCGITDTDILTIDHINGGGNQHRKQLNVGSGTHFFYWLRRNEYPNGYQVLCWNCNVKKRFTEEMNG